MTEPLAWLDGASVPISAARLHVFDLGVVLGASATEMLRTFAGRPFRVEAHLERLFASFAAISGPSPVTAAELADVIDRLVEHNFRLIPKTDDLGIVAFITAGQNATYLGPAAKGEAARKTVCVHTFPLPFAFWTKKLDEGQHVVTPGARQVPPEILDPRLKVRSRLPWFLADRQARAIDPDAVCLALDADGRLTETSTANFFVVRKGTILTPAAGVLEGISRDMVGELAAELGIPYVPRELEMDDAVRADEAFTSSTPYCVLPVTKFNGRPIADGRPGPIFRRLLEAWGRRVGVDLFEQMRR